MTKSMGKKKMWKISQCNTVRFLYAKVETKESTSFFTKTIVFLGLRPSCFSKVLAGAAIANRMKLHN